MRYPAVKLTFLKLSLADSLINRNPRDASASKNRHCPLPNAHCTSHSCPLNLLPSCATLPIVHSTLVHKSYCPVSTHCPLNLQLLPSCCTLPQSLFNRHSLPAICHWLLHLNEVKDHLLKYDTFRKHEFFGQVFKQKRSKYTEFNKSVCWLPCAFLFVFDSKLFSKDFREQFYEYFHNAQRSS